MSRREILIARIVPEFKTDWFHRLTIKTWLRLISLYVWHILMRPVGWVWITNEVTVTPRGPMITQLNHIPVFSQCDLQIPRTWAYSFWDWNKSGASVEQIDYPVHILIENSCKFQAGTVIGGVLVTGCTCYWWGKENDRTKFGSVLPFVVVRLIWWIWYATGSACVWMWLDQQRSTTGLTLLDI